MSQTCPTLEEGVEVKLLQSLWIYGIRDHINDVDKIVGHVMPGVGDLLKKFFIFPVVEVPDVLFHF